MPNTPEMIGPYRILGRLGQGAMGTVYRAEDPRLGRQVAIKTIQLNPGLDQEAEEHARARFMREARSAGSLSHPNIVTVYHLGEHEGLLYLVMELVDGPSLSQFLRSIDDPSRYQVFLWGLQQVARALDHAHERGIIHRDIKPANILVSRDRKFKVADFGIAKILAATELTATGAFIGTPQYIPPESLRGAGVSPASDQYSLGIVAYEVLTRRAPFEADSMEALLFQILLQPPPPVGAFNPGLNPAVDDVLRRALAKDPQARFGSCAEFMEQLVAATSATHPPPPPKASTPKPPDPPQREPSPPTPPAQAIPVMPSPFLSEKQKTPLWKPAGIAALIALVLVIFAFSFIEKSKVKANGYRVPESVPQILLPKELTPPRTVDQLPPVIERAANPRYLINTRQVIGPRLPKAHFRIWSPERATLEMAVIGGDGTMYVSSSDNKLWAVRDGRVQWGFEGLNGRGLKALQDGRIRFETVEFAHGAVFNANGEGGRLRTNFRLPPAVKSAYDLWENSGEYRTACGTRPLPLDHDCDLAATDESGTTYALTVTKNLYAIAANGKRLWMAPMPCRGSKYMVASEGQVIFGCQGSDQFNTNASSLIGVRNGRVEWTFKADQDLLVVDPYHTWSLIVDRMMTTYTTDTADPTHLYAISREGKLLWKYDLGDLRYHHIQLDGQGRIFLSGTHWRENVLGASLICLADSPR